MVPSQQVSASPGCRLRPPGCRLSGVGELARSPGLRRHRRDSATHRRSHRHGGTERDDAADAGASPDVDPAPERHPGGRQVRGRSCLPRFAETGRLPDPAVRSGFLVHDARARLGEHRDDPRCRPAVQARRTRRPDRVLHTAEADQDRWHARPVGSPDRRRHHRLARRASGPHCRTGDGCHGRRPARQADDPRGRSDLHRALPGGLPRQDLPEPHAESGTHLVLGLGHQLIREAATGHPGRQGRRGPDLRRFARTGRPTTASSRRPTRSSARSRSRRSSPVGSARHRRGEPGDNGLGQRPATRHVLRQPQAHLVAGERHVARTQTGQ